MKTTSRGMVGVVGAKGMGLSSCGEGARVGHFAPPMHGHFPHAIKRLPSTAQGIGGGQEGCIRCTGVGKKRRRRRGQLCRRALLLRGWPCLMVFHRSHVLRFGAWAMVVVRRGKRGRCLSFPVLPLLLCPRHKRAFRRMHRDKLVQRRRKNGKERWGRRGRWRGPNAGHGYATTFQIHYTIPCGISIPVILPHPQRRWGIVERRGDVRRARWGGWVREGGTTGGGATPTRCWPRALPGHTWTTKRAEPTHMNAHGGVHYQRKGSAAASSPRFPPLGTTTAAAHQGRPRVGGRRRRLPSTSIPHGLDRSQHVLGIRHRQPRQHVFQPPSPQVPWYRSHRQRHGEGGIDNDEIFREQHRGRQRLQSP